MTEQPPFGPPPAGPPPPGPPPPTGPPLAPGPMPEATGPLLTVGDWLTDTTRTLVHGFGDFFAVLTLVSLLSTAISAPLLWFAVRDVVLVREEGTTITSIEGLTSNQGWMIAAALLVVFTSQILLFTAATNHIDRLRHGQPAPWQDTMRALVTRGPRVLGVVLQVVALAFALLVVSSVFAMVGLGLVGSLVGLAAIVWLWLRCAVASTHAALGQSGGSVAASFRWSKGLVWPLLGRHVLLMTLVVGVLLISSFVAAPFQGLSGAAPVGEGDVAMSDLVGASVPAFVAVQFINALASGVVAALWGSAMLSLLRGDLVDR